MICLEYNSVFPPPVSIAVKYAPAHRWALDMYMGASLQAFVDALPTYRLVSCNVTGTNATFTIQSSSDDGAGDAFAAVTGGAFTQVTGVGWERIQTARALAIERYLRVAVTGTFTSVTFAVIVVRNPVTVNF